MTTHHGLVIAAGPAAPARLVLLLHGVGSRPDSMLALGTAVAAAQPRARVISLRAPHRSDIAFGWQWFSIREISEETRPARVAQAMPPFLAAVRHWQADSGVAARDTALVGFSQGGLMALRSTQVDPVVAGTVISIAGRCSPLPEVAPPDTRIHLIHGEDDLVIPCQRSIEVAERLRTLGATATLDLFPGLGHEIDPGFIACALTHLGADWPD